MVSYSIVIPAFQEADIIISTLKTVKNYLIKQNILNITEVIIVCAKGNDQTARLAHKFANNFPLFKIIEPGKKVGKGRDVKVGVLAAKGRYILFTDADLATPVHYIMPAFRELENGCDIVIGVRDLKTIHKGLRKFVSLSANLITRLLVAPAYPDTQCGFKGFERQVANVVFTRLTVNGWAFDMELLAIATENKLSVVSIDIVDWSEKKPDDKQLAGEDNLIASIRTLREAGIIGWRRTMGKYRIK